MAKKQDIPKDNNIIEVPIEEAMPENYLPYAVEVARDRALPDVRDGLKPVHRRIIYGAYLLKAFPDRPYFKSARIVGDILGKFHPHGDTSVYDAMAILAQDFTTRNPLIDGHGNWGSIDGDGAAAMRYTEARLTPIALEMIKDIDKDVVDMIPNYSDTEIEPKVLPSRYPNLLVNGAFGIAVGLATNIPPHNLKEVIEATIALVDKPDMTTEDIMKYIKGPDLPTGGIIIGRESMLSAYKTGEGKVTLRAKTAIEKLENGRIGIVITEFPYRRNKAKILQTLSDMTGDKKHSKALEAISDIRDESDRTGIRAVIELKKSATEEVADKILKYIFKRTDLQCNLNFNMVALADGKPETLGLHSILTHYINHQKEVVTRRSKRELEIAEKRFHIVEGFIKAIEVMDEIIAIIRASKSKKDAATNLISQFNFTEPQAEAILELMLYRLTGLEIKVFEKEYKELSKTINKLRNILENEKELLKVIKTELLEVLDKYGENRRTEIIEDESEAKIDLEELVVIEDTMITLSKDGFIKRVPRKSYNRISSDLTDIDYREGDFARFLFESNTKDTILFFTDKGNMYQIKGNNVPEYKWKEKGERLDTLIRGLNLEEENIVQSFSLEDLNSSKDFMFFTNKGTIKKTSIDKFYTNYSKIMALKLKVSEKLLDVKLFSKERQEQFIKVRTSNELEFTLVEPVLENVDRATMGSQLFNMPENQEVIEVEYVEEFQYAEYSLGIDRSGNMKLKPQAKEEKYIKVSTNSYERLLIFTDKAVAYNIPAYMLQGIGNRKLNLQDLTGDFSKSNEKVLNIISLKEFKEEINVYFFTKNGLVKRTSLKDFEGDYISTLAYKYKNEEDKLVAIDFGYKDNSSIIVVTKKAMAIKFETTAVSTMGRVASGVTAISLKEDDEVIFGGLTESLKPNLNKLCYNNEIAYTASYEKMVLVSNDNEEKVITIDEMKIQNRAGRGTSLMLVVMGDFIKEIKIK